MTLPSEMIVVDGIRYRPDDPKLKMLGKEAVRDKAVRSPRAASPKRRPTTKRAADGDVADED